MQQNIILNADSYKSSHFLQYPDNTRCLSSYIEARGGTYSYNLFFGLQMYLKQYLLHPLTAADIEEAGALLPRHGLPFNRNGWDLLLTRHAGRMPVQIEAVAEGTILPCRNVMLQIVNTDPDFAWLTTYLETSLLRAVWYPSTVATVSVYCKSIIERYLRETADNTDSLNYKLHDFGARGASSCESAAIGGCAHLVNFHGSDTLGAIIAARDYYHSEMAGFSIPAAEHSTITCWGREHEGQAFANMIDRFCGPDRTVAVVSDSYDIWHTIDHLWGGVLKNRVQTNGGTLVIRPDSGDPVEITSRVIEKLMEHFGYSENRAGYRELPGFVRVIQGDGVSPAVIESILEAMKTRGLSAENIAFGMGAELLQKVNRDTQGYAMKVSAARIGADWTDVCKQPATDAHKRSRKGRLALVVDENQGFVTIPSSSLEQRSNLLRPVYRNGELLVDESLDEIRARARHGLKRIRAEDEPHAN